MGDFLEISSKSCGLWGESERQEWGTDVHLERSGDKRAGGNPTNYTVVVGFISILLLPQSLDLWPEASGLVASNTGKLQCPLECT